MATAKVSRKATPKRAATKTASKKAVAKKTVTKKSGMTKGSRYTCGVCGLSVTVDNACGCAETAHLICCEKPMKMKR